MSLHACASSEPEKCVGDECARKCDSMGCQFDPLALGAMDFFGPGARVDSSKPITVHSRVGRGRRITEDGTDTGKLSKVRRFYTQNGQTIENAKPDASTFPTLLSSNSVTDEFCAAQKELQGTSAGEGYLGRPRSAPHWTTAWCSPPPSSRPSPPRGLARAPMPVRRATPPCRSSTSCTGTPEITSTCPTCDDQVTREARGNDEEESEQVVVADAAKKAAPKPFVQTDAFRYIMYGAGILTLGLVGSTCASGKSAGFRPPAGNPRGRR
ncbi:unnamed protein product [Prorocentrum cordatum]|uniref:cellulose 1,4-beta-cellobiosidase (non-reducing end) n=1 Tax=Prorocentrum cordatum TaxID=2364126 RepID=A0ABN9THR7_9DINO|nr:unnamed protein product [Polarella glacialis]